jgi:hypothetical protein
MPRLQYLSSEAFHLSNKNVIGMTMMNEIIDLPEAIDFKHWSVSQWRLSWRASTKIL